MSIARTVRVRSSRLECPTPYVKDRCLFRLMPPRSYEHPRASLCLPLSVRVTMTQPQQLLFSDPLLSIMVLRVSHHTFQVSPHRRREAKVTLPSATYFHSVRELEARMVRQFIVLCPAISGADNGISGQKK